MAPAPPALTEHEQLINDDDEVLEVVLEVLDELVTELEQQLDDDDDEEEDETPSLEEELAALEAKASAGMLLTDEELERMRILREIRRVVQE